MMWFDLGLWFMVTHLDDFFDEVGIAAKFMAFIHFLSKKAKDVVLDHITFTFIREMMIEACLNLYNDPLAPVLKERMNTHVGIIIKRLIKSVAFTKNLVNSGNEPPLKRCWDLNDNSSLQHDSKKRFTPCPFSQGYGQGDDCGWNNTSQS